MQGAFLGRTIVSELLTINLNRKKCYDIKLESDFVSLVPVMTELYDKNRKVMIVTDSTVADIYLSEVHDMLSAGFDTVCDYIFEAGENSKNHDTLMAGYDALIANHFNRHDVIIALGGGVVGDLSGYLAATYMRGIDYVQVPTTLLSMVDSSIGGKCGIDYKEYKNMIGAFKMPRLVYMNLSCLKTLDDRQYAAGMAEVIKSALIRDGSYYEWLINNFPLINERDNEILYEMIKHCIGIKAGIVERDPYEAGERALLNFGHTIGHALEKYKDFTMLHGECVALGAVAAAYISWKRELLSMEEYYEIRDMFVPFNLPISVDDIDCDEILKLTKSDKKADGATVKFVLLKKIGKGVVVSDVSDDEIITGIDEIKAKF